MLKFIDCNDQCDIRENTQPLCKSKMIDKRKLNIVSTGSWGSGRSNGSNWWERKYCEYLSSILHDCLLVQMLCVFLNNDECSRQEGTTTVSTKLAPSCATTWATHKLAPSWSFLTVRQQVSALSLALPASGLHLRTAMRSPFFLKIIALNSRYRCMLFTVAVHRCFYHSLFEERWQCDSEWRFSVKYFNRSQGLWNTACCLFAWIRR